MNAGNRYVTQEREPFFELVVQAAVDAGVQVRAAVDLGPGDTRFADLLQARFPACAVTLLEGNPHTVQALRARVPDVRAWVAPAPLPMADASVDLLHTSHLVEHLPPDAVYALMLEADRVLRPGGILAISAPLLWEGFYYDLSHLKPYEPEVFVKYLAKPFGSQTRPSVSTSYEVLRKQYRLRARKVFAGWHADSPAGRTLIAGVRRVLTRAGVRELERTGFTLVLRKAPVR